MKVGRCKGMKDLSPAEMTVFRAVEGIYRDCCMKWGYREVRTPTIEYLHLFTSAGTLTPGMLGRVYSFLDWDGWSGERVVLRPDGTIPVARFYTESREGRGLARLFYATSILMFEETAEQTRERWQCGAELIGAGSVMADTELLLLSLEVLDKLGLKDVELRLSHAGLIKSLLAKLGLSPEEQTRTFDRILDGDDDALAKVAGEFPAIESALRPLLSLKGQSPGFIRNQRALLAKDIPEIAPHLDDLLEMVTVLDELGCAYRIDIASGSGFEYYTGMMFELYIGGEKVGGGGRYDELIPSMGGGDVPASGFALYLDRLAAMVKPDAIAPAALPEVLVRAKTGGTAAMKDVFATADRLRATGYIAEVDLTGEVNDTVQWLVEVAGKSQPLTMTDTSDKRKSEVPDVAGLLTALEGTSGR